MILQISDLEQRYGTRQILDIPTWGVSHGIYWIQGENGAGKSTLFRVLAGMLPFQGDITLNQKYSLKKDPVAYRLRLNLGEAEPLYPAFLTPADLISFVAEARDSPTGQAESLIEGLGINYLTQPFGSCSSGMIKKLSLVLAFLGNPSVIILDEPLITIDLDAQAALFELIKKYYDDGVTFLLSSHQLFKEGGLPLTARYILRNQTLVESSVAE
jgi:ABC-2 type transport system ATP-binding protein